MGNIFLRIGLLLAVFLAETEVKRYLNAKLFGASQPPCKSYLRKKQGFNLKPLTNQSYRFFLKLPAGRYEPSTSESRGILANHHGLPSVRVKVML